MSSLLRFGLKGSQQPAVTWVVALVFLASLVLGGVAAWRLRVEQRNDVVVKKHLQRESLRQLAVDLQRQTEQIMALLWPPKSDKELLAPQELAATLQRHITPRSWFWSPVILDPKGQMLWPQTPWEGPDDSKLMAAGESGACADVQAVWKTAKAGLAARLAAAHRINERLPGCLRQAWLRKLLLQDLHWQSRGRRKWLYVSSSQRAFWVVTGPSHLLLLRLVKGRHVGVGMPLKLLQPAPLPGAMQGARRVWLQRSPASAETRPRGDWFPLAGPLAGFALWMHEVPGFSTSSVGTWAILGGSLVATWIALVALLLFGRKRAQWEAHRQALFSAITHELKTPVAAQLALLDTIQRLAGGNVSTHHLALRRETVRMQQLLQHVLALYHDVPPADAFQRCDLTALTHQLLEDLEPAAESKGLALGCEHRRPCWVRIEPTSMALALRNLIDNAIKYTPPDGWVEVDIAPGDGLVRWSIRDSGSGVPEALRAQIFSPFVRGESREVAGSGLGLPLAQKIMAQQGGELVLLPGDHATGGFCATFRTFTGKEE